ncbi:hypothetical protein J4526_02230 [Desulfurococcaceae archaeon MEX13E-LK6-19]|nr:hypothetical protein J4526_02230 [Desulfurococcaceae archaeon MEX13E-LK6-19]
MEDSPIDILNRLKKAIDDYEKIIDLTKIILNEVRAYGDSNKIPLLSRRLSSILKELELVGSMASSKGLWPGNDTTVEYLNVFSRYIALVSIPYEKDLINEIKEKFIETNNTKRINELNELLKIIDKVEEIYAKLVA